jgi:hypothetical protein
VFLDEISLNSRSFGVVIQSIALPTTAALPQNILTGQFSQSQGGLWRSENGQFISFSGWNAPVSSSAAGSSTGGTIAVCNYLGVCDTSITTNSASNPTPGIGGNNMRSSVTNDGINFWTTGTNGLEYEIKPGTATCTGASSCNTLIQPFGNTSFNYRSMVLQNGQMYATTQGSPIYGVITYGLPNPTTPNGTTPSTVILTPNGASSQIHGLTFVNNSNTLVYGDRASGVNGGGITAFSRASPDVPYVLQWSYPITNGAQYVYYDSCSNRIYFTSTEGNNNFIYYIPYSTAMPTDPPTLVGGNFTGSFLRGMTLTPVGPTVPAGSCFSPAPAPGSSGALSLSYSLPVIMAIMVSIFTLGY